MSPKPSPEASGAILARLDALRNRKAVLDELIPCLERYAEATGLIADLAPRWRTSFRRRSPSKESTRVTRRAGAA
jgi:hypothetical protein